MGDSVLMWEANTTVYAITNRNETVQSKMINYYFISKACNFSTLPLNFRLKLNRGDLGMY